MSTLPRLNPAAKVSGASHNRLVDEFSKTAALGGVGLRTSTFQSGTLAALIKAPPFIRRNPPSPFRIYDASSGATLKLGVVSGTVNGVVPTLGGTALDNATPPTLTITATRYLWLKVVGTFGSPDTYAITVEDSATSATPSGTAISGTAFTSFLSIGYATVASGAITGIYPTNNANWNAESFGSTNIWWK